MHLWDAEPDVFTPGDREPPVVDTECGRIGVLVCYDAEFPEWVRKPALAGADLLAVPTNWPAEPRPPGERPMVVLNVQAAASANRVFVAAADRCGTERGVSWTGGAVIAGPDGYPLAGPVLRRTPRPSCWPTATCGWPAARPAARGTTCTRTGGRPSTAEARAAGAGYFFLARVSPSPTGSITSSTRSSAPA